jgi:hypothetical protein
VAGASEHPASAAASTATSPTFAQAAGRLTSPG